MEAIQQQSRHGEHNKKIKRDNKLIVRPNKLIVRTITEGIAQIAKKIIIGVDKANVLITKPIIATMAISITTPASKVAIEEQPTKH
ncbi:MAG: hypothetical protein WDZ28_03100 [Simkaniaceae bacterium]